MPGLIICGAILSNQSIKSSPEYPFNIEFLLVAGGGAGGSGQNAGTGAGGGAGGLVYHTAFCVTSSNVNVTLPVVVGSGGTGRGGNGSNSTFLSYVACGRLS